MIMSKFTSKNTTANIEDLKQDDVMDRAPPWQKLKTRDDHSRMSVTR